LHGPEQEVIFEQQNTPGDRAQSDFTHIEELEVILADEPFPHMTYHFVLTYSNTEGDSLCFSETFEALAEGHRKSALADWRGSAATRKSEGKEFLQ
jgi:hypothetical protein